MSWTTSLQTAGSLALSTLKFLGSLLYLLAAPLRWPVYFLYSFVAFVLSPVWFVISLGLGAIAYAVDLAIRLKSIYIYLACAAFIGLCAGAVLHGTSSFIFVLFGVDAASQRERQRNEQYKRQLQTLSMSADEEEEEDNNHIDDEDYDYNTGGNDEDLDFSLGSSTTRLGSTSTSVGGAPNWRRWGGSRAVKEEEEARLDPIELFEKRWRQLRTTPEPGRKRRGSKGLLAQTIHEESSESDFT